MCYCDISRKPQAHGSSIRDLVGVILPPPYRTLCPLPFTWSALSGDSSTDAMEQWARLWHIEMGGVEPSIPPVLGRTSGRYHVSHASWS